MKKIKVLLFSLLILLLTSCAGKSIEDKILGSWSFSVGVSGTNYTATYTYEFKEDGVCEGTISMAGLTKSETGTYRVEDGNIIVAIASDSPQFTYTEDGDNVNIYYEGLQLTKE